MPIWNGMTIPFDPAFIAYLLYSGEMVFPDKGAPEAQLMYEDDLINAHLRQLWGNQEMRGVDAVKRHQRFGGGLDPDPGRQADRLIDAVPFQDINLPFKRVVPNPFMQFQTPVIDRLRPGNPAISQQASRPVPAIDPDVLKALGMTGLIPKRGA